MLKKYSSKNFLLFIDFEYNSKFLLSIKNIFFFNLLSKKILKKIFFFFIKNGSIFFKYINIKIYKKLNIKNFYFMKYLKFFYIEIFFLINKIKIF
ncbi:hypothetical protein NASALF_161 [Candidatus Nasuia deltocephalinicola str. NAS-ALF]|uniref:Uncharacterized protein n=1 Tax=Candidatus Nasuia deltocephalinicola str. NAS-ALF TaxID=1343077 RepID=S5SQC4_9PROT|nr:hypothetical protein NASALF_161 [Candidatus Nasuia deltocephalinicola str. NAS-ALF]